MISGVDSLVLLKILKLHEFAWHPCVGAVLIFSASYQFQCMCCRSEHKSNLFFSYLLIDLLRVLPGHLGDSVGWGSYSWFWLMSWSLGHGVEPHVGLHTEYGACLGFSLLSPCTLSLSKIKIKKKNKNYWAKIKKINTCGQQGCRENGCCTLSWW